MTDRSTSSRNATVRVQLIAKPGPGMTGTTRYAESLQSGLLAVDVDAELTFPSGPPLPQRTIKILTRRGIDITSFLASYPLRARPAAADVYHITSQTMATLLMLQRFPGPTVVTVLDIIPFLNQNSPTAGNVKALGDRMAYRLAMKGLQRAQRLIAISEYTKQTLVEHLRIPADRIAVTHLGVDTGIFRPMEAPQSFRIKYGLGAEFHYLLFVGSDDPRKNLLTLVSAFASIGERYGNIKLLKVGSECDPGARLRLKELIAGLGLEDRVLFFDSVPDSDLPWFYNAAEIFIMPSLSEGFGLPVLEAMACGTPVICANSTSLPEVAGKAAVLIDATDDRQLASALVALLENHLEMDSMQRRGLEHAARFTWQRTAEQTAQVYAQLV